MKALAATAVAFVLVIGGISLVAQQAQQPTPAQLQANMKIAMEFYRPGITPEERIALIHPDYQQHNQTYVKYAKDHNVSAFEAFSQIRRQQGVDQAAAAAAARAAAAAKGPLTLPQAPAGNTFHILYAEGDLSSCASRSAGHRIPTRPDRSTRTSSGIRSR
jgi:hypothetical protein